MRLPCLPLPLPLPCPCPALPLPACLTPCSRLGLFMFYFYYLPLCRFEQVVEIWLISANRIEQTVAASPGPTVAFNWPANLAEISAQF